MTNKEIATAFRKLGAIMELHGENAFKIRSYTNAYINLRKLDKPLTEMEESEIAELKGVGKAINAKIKELIETGTLQTYQKYVDKTPPGIVDLLGVKGFGPKKIKSVWDGLGIETAGELLYACNENRLVELKGFGLKSQEDLKQKIEYFLASQNKFHYATSTEFIPKIEASIKAILPKTQFAFTGEMRRAENTIECVELLIEDAASLDKLFESDFEKVKKGDTEISAKFQNEIPVTFYPCPKDEFSFHLVKTTGGLKEGALENISRKGKNEEEVFAEAKLTFLAPELRHEEIEIEKPEDIITEKDILGVIHSHTTYSDGLHSLEEMAESSKELGYQYLGITDHSKSAFYANGLSIERLEKQLEEIDALNKRLTDFTVLKGIESDVLNDGSLDYPDEVLDQLDFVIASVHSNLKMDEQKATQRIITAIESPYTSILGHPTGRLLLSRKGYPIDHAKVIDACAANGVSIELNANPYRLDIDWTWIPYCMERGVKISINPDAHSKSGILDIKWGVISARKGGLRKDMCLNAMPLSDFMKATKKT